MERNPARTLRLSPQPFRGRVIGQYLPAILLAGAAFLVVREVKGGGDATTSPSSTVQAKHSQVLADRIQLFEGLVMTTPERRSPTSITA